MRELDTIAKENLRDDIAEKYYDMFNMIIADYTDDYDDDDTLQDIASFVQECLTELTNRYTKSLANLNH